MIRPIFNQLRMIALATLLIAAILPLSTCEKRQKTRIDDGSLTHHTYQEERNLWREIGRSDGILDTSMIALCCAWPLPFLLFRRLIKTRRTHWSLGTAESIIGGFYMLATWVMVTEICWEITGVSQPHLEPGYYLMMAGHGFYLAAWPLESLYQRHAR